MFGVMSKQVGELLLRALKKGGYDPVSYERVESGPAMEVALARRKWDVVVADHNMPRFSAIAALELLWIRATMLQSLARHRTNILGLMYKLN